MTAVNWDTISAAISGQRVLMILPTIPDDGPPELREGIARRRLIAISGQCPCGARLTHPNRQERRAAARRKQTIHTWVEHAEDCPAVDSTLIPLIREANR